MLFIENSDWNIDWSDWIMIVDSYWYKLICMLTFTDFGPFMKIVMATYIKKSFILDQCFLGLYSAG